MRRLLTSAALAAAVLASGARAAEPLAAPADAAGDASAARAGFLGPPEEELALARTAFDQGLPEFVALRMRRLLERDAFAGRDQAELLLAKSDYLCGRHADAERLLNEMPKRYPKSPWLLECRLWIGRAEVELVRPPEELARRRAAAETRLRELLAELDRLPQGRLERGTQNRLTRACRYFLCLAMVELGGNDRLDDLTDARGSLLRAGAITLLRQQVREGGDFLAEALILLGKAYYLRGRPDDCFNLFRDRFLGQDVGRANPQLRAQALYWQAEARYGQAKWEEAAGLFARAAEAAARSGVEAGLRERSLYSRGWALEKRAADLHRSGLAGEREALEAALTSFQQVIALKAGALASAAELRAGAVLNALGRHGEALARLEPLYADPLRSAEAHYLAALAQSGLGRHQEARTLLDQAGKQAGEKSPLAEPIAFARGENAFRLGLKASGGREAFGRPEWGEALSAFRNAQALARDETDLAYEAQLWIARTLARQGRFQEAADKVAELLAVVPAVEALRRDRLAYYRGEFLLGLAQHDAGGGRDRLLGEAVDSFTAARQAGPRSEFAVPAMLGAAGANLLRNSVPEAFRLYSLANQDPGAGDEQLQEARLGIARSLQAGQRYQQAAAFLKTHLLEAKPAPSASFRQRALRLRADCLATAGDAAAAAETYGRLADDLAPGEEAARARLDRAAEFRKLGQHGNAAAELAALAASCPPAMRQEAACRAAEACAAAGRGAEAVKLFLEAAGQEGRLAAEARIGAAELMLEAAPGQADAAGRLARQAREELIRTGRRESLLAVRASLVLGKALSAGGDAPGAAGQYRLAVSEAIVVGKAEADRKEARRLEFAGYLGLGRALVAAGRPEDAAASFLNAAYLPDRGADAELRAELRDQVTGALAAAAAALDSAGQPRAAEQVRALLPKQK